MSSVHKRATPIDSPWHAERERLTDLERRSLLAEQARHQAHRLRTPLSVVKLISETLQLEFSDDRARSERIQRMLGAVLTLSSNLTDAVSATRFGDNAPRRLDVVALAARVVQAFGGRVVWIDGDAIELTGLTGGTDIRGPDVVLESDSFEAALVHALRLIGVGYHAENVNRPLLQCRRSVSAVMLRLSADRPRPQEIPNERADLQLMALAANRAARDCGGTFTLASDDVTFELPVE